MSVDVRRFLNRRLVMPVALALRGERRVWEYVAALRALESEGPEALLARQRARLTEALRYAWDRSPHYRTAWPESPPEDPGSVEGFLRQISPLEKATLRSEAERLRADPPPRGKVSSKTTGGSTGEPVTVLKDGDAIAHERAASWLGYGWVGIEPSDRGARFWGNPTSWRRRMLFRAADAAMNRIRFSAFAFTEQDLDAYWLRCLAFRPRYLYGYVSMLVDFAAHLERRGLDGRRLGLTAVIATSEVLSPSDQQALSGTFGCVVQNEYGCGELGPIAYSCEAGKLHVMSTNVFLEVVDSRGAPVEEGGVGEILVTDLNNRAMPLVRYRIGDRAEVGAACACGRPFPVLERVWGRAYDFIVAPDGRRFHGEYFLYHFEEMRERGIPFDRFQVRQTRPDKLEVLICHRGSLAEHEAFLRERVSSALPGVELELRRAEQIPRAPSGKTPLIVNELASGGRAS